MQSVTKSLPVHSRPPSSQNSLAKSCFKKGTRKIPFFRRATLDLPANHDHAKRKIL
jgi:hypothetical protein